ncbi:MAG TPA: prenyltransferase/squalene oxidase repeat-containing protein [Burkholderiales bacterium]|nr:prenyltransferase/squalene oxidase repeat-containing protein [Burkholderiales bacterium]
MNFFRRPNTSAPRALNWFRGHMVPGQGIIVHTKQPVPYAEVTGYFVPTLYEWGETDLARTCIRWLASIQLAEGAFPAPDGVPYSFDTAQVIRGLCAAVEHGEDVRAPLHKACEWLASRVDDEGRITTPSTALWGDIASDLIHSYAIHPLLHGGRLLGEHRHVEAARRAQAYYTAQAALVPFNRLTHFHAYAMEALWELGEDALVRRGMAEVADKQRSDGAIPAYPDVDWVCSTGMAQYAVVWYRLGERMRADKAMRYLEGLQNKSGGFYGSYGPGAKYIAGAEISWAVKYFLDAHRLRTQEIALHA